MGDSVDCPVILGPRNIISYSIPNIDRNPTCEDVLFSCIEELARSTVLRENPQPDEDLMKWLPAFGLVKEGIETIWLPPGYVFKRTIKREVYKLRIRHRPPLLQIFSEDCFFSEFLLLQTLDDFLFGQLGKQLQMQRSLLMQLLALALLFPVSYNSHPWKNGQVIDENHKVEKFGLLKYDKRFSKEIYRKIIPTKSVVNRWIDHYHHHGAFQVLIEKYKSKDFRRFLDYKRAFLKIILENCPHYCFEQYEVLVIDDYGEERKATISLSLYAERTDEEAGIYIDQTRFCGLEDVETIHLKKQPITKNDTLKWILEIFTKAQPQVWLFESEDMAISFVTMLQGYMTLAVRPDFTLCRQLAVAGRDKISSVTIREKLRSFCPMGFSKAYGCLMNENLQKGENDKCGFMIHQSMKHLRTFFVVTKDNGETPECSIEWIDGNLFRMKGTNRPLHDLNPGEHLDYEGVRRYLKAKYGQQLFAGKVALSIDPDSVFFIHKTLLTTFLESSDVSEIGRRLPPTVLEQDITDRMPYQSSELDSNLERSVVDVRDEKRIELKLVPKRKIITESFNKGVSLIAELGRIHPTIIMNYFGPVLSPTAPLPFLFEYSEYRDLLTFLQGNEKGITTVMRMEFALEVAKILCSLTNPGQGFRPLLHGNLRGYNFWVFKSKKGDRFYLKLGDPGLVFYHNTLELKEADNKGKIPWLSPERQQNLSEVTIESECYAAATTIAEIFHGNDQFQTVIVQNGMEIPLPKFPESEDEAVMESVKEVISKLWNTLKLCWVAEPKERLAPRDLNDAIIDHLEEIRAIPYEKVLHDFRAYVARMYHIDTKHMNSRECHGVLQDRNQEVYIKPHRVTIGPVILGSGNFGSVKKGKVGDMDVAIKMSNKGQHDKFEADLRNEAKLCAKLAHGNIVKFKYQTYWGRIFCIILEFMNQGSLKSYAKTNSPLIALEQRETERTGYIKQLLDFSIDVAKGMAYLQSVGVIHCDLAARNVLLHKDSSGFIAKVADFGLSKVLLEHQDYYYVKDMKDKPLYWYPPEYLRIPEGEDPNHYPGISFSSAGDVWAYGTTLWEIFSKGMSPSVICKKEFPNFDNDHAVDILFRYFMVEKKRWPRMEYVDCDIYDVMLKCWDGSPRRRPTFTLLQEEIQKLTSIRTRLEK